MIIICEPFELSFTQLKFEGITGTSYQGDIIAIDDISVTDGSCSAVPPSTLPPSSPTPSQGGQGPGKILIFTI